jgi:hypothetical protein
MEKHLSIVKVDKRPYRTIAQENWGLTKEQMKGRHVHHRIPVSDEGTDDPTNLYVCTGEYHDTVWHGKDGGFIALAAEGGRKGGAKTAELGVGVHGRTPEQMTEDARKGGAKAAELGVGVHAPGKRSEGGKKAAELGVGAHAPEMRGVGAKITNSQHWVCLVTGHVSTSGPLSQWQRARGIDTSMRVKLAG